MSGGNGACAVCKHQRRKCEPNCELAAYFPANKMNDFRALHLVYGVANLTKLIKANGTEAARRRAAETLTWEAQWRERDPAEGCYREVSCLRRENTALRAENSALRRQAAQCACGAPRHAPSPALQQQLLVSAYGHGNTRPCNAYASNIGVTPNSLDGNCYNICYNGNGGNAGAVGVRGVNGNGVMTVMPHVPTPAMQTTISHAEDDRYRAMSVRAPANGGHGAVGALGSGVAG